jgi:hypothetical protein
VTLDHNTFTKTSEQDMMNKMTQKIDNTITKSPKALQQNVIKEASNLMVHAFSNDTTILAVKKNLKMKSD